jgi:hypothetical protein
MSIDKIAAMRFQYVLHSSFIVRNRGVSSYRILDNNHGCKRNLFVLV